ncbi:MAG TPA: DNA translocase FtsK 4TM domain-containing protein [Lacipirellulaceae bacterium]|nr:DNA translocase FtsK 4TM domain-containing protein [Lacipirellulaceae bacterium]
MFENRSLKLDLFALALLAGCALVVAALGSYDPCDPPGTLLYPPREAAANRCGPVGAYVAHWLFASVGYAAYYVVGSLAAVSLLLLTRREMNQPILRGAGWAASLAAIATLAAMTFRGWTPGPEVGAGGYLGAMGFALLESQFAIAGAFILTLSILLAGLLLSTDYLLIKLAAKTTVVGGTSLVKLGRAGQRVAAATTLRRASDLDVAINQADDDASDAEGEQDEYEYEYEYEYDEDESDEAGDHSPWEESDDEDEEEREPVALKVKTPATKAEAAEGEGAPADAAPSAAVAAAGAIAAPSAADEDSAAIGIKNNRSGKAPKRTERDEMIDQLEAANALDVADIEYELPPLDLLLPSDEVCYEEHEKEVRKKAKTLEKTFKNFGFNVKVVEIETGPVIAQFEVELEAGLRLSKITGLADDLAIALRVPSVRIVAPIPGKNTVGIEVPNENRQLVRLREVIEEANGRAKRMKIPIYLGKDVAGNPLTVDLTSLPHLLIAGRTGTGKSVCLNSIIVSMIMSRGPDEVRMLMIDPKMVELSGYRKLPHLMHPVVTDMRKAEAILSWAVDKMEERYALLARAGVRHVTVYNQLSDEELRERIEPTSELEWESIPRSLPFIVIVADEIADLMMTSGKEVEQHIIRLAQKSRAVGIHLILATQKPTVDVITGLIKSNLPARIAFQVASRTDSRVVLDEMGADKLLGNGDMLFLSPGTSQLLRGQGTFLSDDEITRVTEFVATDSPQFARELIELKTKDEQEMAQPGELKNRDELYEAAVDIVVRERRGSVSLLQRCLGIGYGRAARLIDFMAEDKIVGEYNGAQAREVMISIEDWEARAANDGGDGGAPPAGPAPPLTALTAPPKPRRITKILPGADEPSDLEDEGAGSRADDQSELEQETNEDEGRWAARAESENTDAHAEQDEEESAELDDEWDDASDETDETDETNEAEDDQQADGDDQRWEEGQADQDWDDDDDEPQATGGRRAESA